MSATLAKTSPKPLNPLLAKYLASLVARPLYTKALTAGTLCFLQEVVANHIAGVPIPLSKYALNSTSPALLPIASIFSSLKIDARAFKLALYGFFVSAPMGHVLVGALQKAFAGKTGPGAKIGMLLANNLVVAPIQTFVYVASMAIIGGARNVNSVLAGVKAGYWKVLQITWMTSPAAVLIAQKYLDPQFHILFFNLVSFALGTTFNVVIKKAKLRAIREQQKKDKAKGQ